jgi:NTE family protein
MPTKQLNASSKGVVDIVMEGGGVKGIGLVGALDILGQHYDFRRIAGSSTGAIVGAFLAAGMTPSQIETLLDETDLTKFNDPNLLSRLGTIGQGAALLFSHGLHKGNTLKTWIASILEQQGVTTFADLKLHETWARDLPPEQRYKLVVIVADIGRGRLLRLPWDYHLLGLNPNTQFVADAIRASASIPFFYEPVRIDKLSF